ncbi:FAD-dependent monooxygenase [Amycolatopsis endophytica]|uniref:2-polyprenyl-6-methoxyphenol hydroxylase-like FAD-dependent oxidoreductase n=1 Tax=Amycolatopsis endophytica TaxID=860233 RepID=A0A853B1V0_9PSEU|nr:FAD-dependent monooxygenase [Amycolatopsis endophytica]NYI88815.1 2-polyprenyl-6-methoxyphenol hydroxylase-like FAD-dependent oxidoreductase [Amycolatopsis endophytica]
MVDVVIAGAGPVGLFLAGELALGGCSVLVLERDPAPASPLKALPLGLRGLNAGSVEAFYRRGMLDRLLTASGARAGAQEQARPRDVSHFAGMRLDAADIDPAALAYRLPGPVSDGIMTSLDAVGTVLAERADALGVRIVRGAAVEAVTQDGDTVLVRAGGRDHRARWLVGCDGGRSTVRRLAGFDFAGTEPLLTGYAAHVTFDDPTQLALGFTLTPTGMYLRTPFEGHLGMMDFDGGAFDRSQPLTREHLQSVLRRVSGTDATIGEVRLATSFTDRAMQATTYRRGRVLLAGDAAHIHSPLGGQGLNLGIGDAVNLGWKLAATITGTAPENLLDTYTAERHPVGAAILDWSRSQVATMHPGPHAPALRRLVHDLLATRDGTTHVFRHTAGLSHRYDLGDDQPLVGTTAPDFRFRDGTRLGELLRDGQGVVLDFTAGQRLRDAATAWQGLRHAAGPVDDDLGFGALLVRPDGVVAWAGDHDCGAGDFGRAARRWFGEPAT